MITFKYQFFFVLFFFPVFALTLNATTRSVHTRIPTDQWAVKLSPGSDPEKTAQSLGAINKGTIANLSDTYLYEIPESALHAQNTRKRIKQNSNIIWIQQQVRRWRFLRNPTQRFADPLFPYQWHLSNTGQHGGTPGADVHILPPWDDGINGNGIVIGIVDDGVQHVHPDLSPNYVSEWSYDFNDNDTDPSPFMGFIFGDSHGTSVAGVAAARDNDSCGVGAAFRASIAGLRLLASEVSDADEANCLSYKRDHIHIYSNSWGPADGEGPEAPGPLTLAAISDNINHGRNGLGNIYVFAAGNGLQYADNVNLDGYANIRYAIAVSAVDQYGTQSYYSEPGACIHVCAPSDGRIVGIYTTDLMSQFGSDTSGDCTGSFGGTSSAAPLVSGIIALMLETAPNLSWRDVQHILVKSAEQNDPDDDDWQTNAAGLHINHKYGFGRVHAENAVKMARYWQSVSQEETFASETVVVNQPIPDNTGNANISQTKIQANIILEHVAIVFTSIHDCAEQLEITLISPSGTESILSQPQSSIMRYDKWMFTSVRHWGEFSDGLWTLKVKDMVSGCTGNLKEWQLTVYGENAYQKVNQPPIAVEDQVQSIKNKSVQIMPLINDIDADNDDIQIIDISEPIHGKLVEFSNNIFTYIPNADFIGQERLIYTITDQQNTDKGTILINIMDLVNQTNNTSQVIPDADPRGVISELNMLSGGRIADIDIQIDLTHEHIPGLSAYLISPNKDQFLLFANLNTTQTHMKMNLRSTSDVKLSDAAAPFTGTYLPASSLKTLENTIAAGIWQLMIIDNISNHTGLLVNWHLQIIHDAIDINSPPEARSDQFHTYPGMQVCMDVLENDSDPNGQNLEIVNLDSPSHGNAYIADCGIVYQPDSEYNGVDYVQYEVINEKKQTDSAQVEIIVASDLALSFNGINDQVYCGTPAPLDIQNRITIELWIHPTHFGELDIQGFGRLIDRERYILFLNEGGRDDYADHSLMFAIEHPTGVMVMGNTPQNSILLNNWQHIAANYDSHSRTMKIYINGKPQPLTYPFGYPNDTIATSQNNPFYIGESNNQERAFQGMMDEIRIWNTIRSDDEILSNMSQTFSTIPDGLVTYWPMRPLENYLHDMSPNQVHCRIQSPKWVPGLMQWNIPEIWSDDDVVYTKMDTPITFNPLENDGLTGLPRSLEISSNLSRPRGQMTILSDFTIAYTPDSGFLGTDQYTYTITTQDGLHTSSQADMRIVADFSLSYDNRNDFVNAGSSHKWALDGPITMTAWIKPKDTSLEKEEQLDYIVDKYGFSIFINHQHSRYFDDKSLVFWRNQSDGSWYAGSTPDYSIIFDQWQHIGVVDNNDGHIWIYINGEVMTLLENGTYSQERATHSQYPFILGNASDLQHAFQGLMDEIYIWSEARSQAQIQRSMNECFPVQTNNLLAYWPVTNENKWVQDFSVNDLNGMISDVQFKEGVLPRYPVSLQTIISSLEQINGLDSVSVCVEDIHQDMRLGIEEVLFLFDKFGY